MGIAYTGLLISLGVITYTVTPSLQELYSSVEVSPPPQLQYMNYFIGLAMVVLAATAVYYFRKPIDQPQLAQKLKKYKNDEMILLNQVLDMQETQVAVGIFVGTFILFGASKVKADFSSVF